MFCFFPCSTTYAHPRKSGNHGFTLVELLVAMTLFAILGLMLVRITRGISENWRIAESQQKLQETAQHIFGFLQEDLQSLYCLQDQSQEIQFISDVDLFQRPRLRFIRKFSLAQYPTLHHAGKNSVHAGDDQYFYGVPLPNQKLRASNGLAEVAYFISPIEQSQELLRGFRTPLGGTGSFFDHRNVQSVPFTSTTCNSLANNVLYFGIQGWTQHTTSWKASGLQGPIQQWNIAGTIPIKIQIQLALFGDHIPQAELLLPLAAHQNTATIQEVANFPLSKQVPSLVKIDDEWMAYQEYQDGRLVALVRGQLGTLPQNHKKDAAVRWGQWFYITILLPDSNRP